MDADRAEPLLPTTVAVATSSLVWSSVNLFATTVGAGVLSVPISFAYCGSVVSGLLVLGAFCALSEASLWFLVEGAERTSTGSYLALGERCFGSAGSAAALWSLLGLLGGAMVQIFIIVIDIVHMLLSLWGASSLSRTTVAAGVTVLAAPLCLPHELMALRFTSSLSVGAILFTCGCIVSLCALDRDGLGGLAPREGDPAAELFGVSGDWPLALPIFSLAFCSHFQIHEIASVVPAARRRELVPFVVHVAMGAACVVYALVGVVCYLILGERALLFPNVLTAFGDVPLVALGSAAIGAVNFLKLPLVLLPLRALLLESCAVGRPLGRASHVALTFALVGSLGSLATVAGSLALAFQMAGSTAGVMVCFILPGAFYAATAASPVGRVAGVAMSAIGVASGALCLVRVLSAGVA